MAQSFIEFSCLLDLRSPENLERALELYRDYISMIEARKDDGVGLEVCEYRKGGSILWLQDADGKGDLEQVIQFVLQCAESFDLFGRWGFTWTITSPHEITDSHGGGAQLLDLTARKSLDWIDCETWLALGLAKTGDQSTPP